MTTNSVTAEGAGNVIPTGTDVAQRANNVSGTSQAAAGQAPASQATIDIKQLAKRIEMFFALGLVLLFVVVFIIGRVYWDDRYYVPEEGIGYFLGLVGGVMMLLASGYGLFKHIPSLRTLGWMRRWLKLHIFLGVIGPFLILIHSTFRIGSLNGGVALVSMLLVFLSGIMGRYLYSKTHYGLGGAKASTVDVKNSLLAAGKRIKSRRLESFSSSVMAHPSSLLGAWWDLMTFGWRSRWLSYQLRRDMRRQINKIGNREGWGWAERYRQRKAFRKQLRDYMYVLRKVALLSVYERFFAFWRHAHVPLLILLFISGILHVIAVHIY